MNSKPDLQCSLLRTRSATTHTRVRGQKERQSETRSIKTNKAQCRYVLEVKSSMFHSHELKCTFFNEFEKPFPDTLKRWWFQPS